MGGRKIDPCAVVRRSGRWLFTSGKLGHRLWVMPVMMRTIQTAVPPTILYQDKARDVFAAQPGLTRLGQRLIATSFDSAQISTRHTAVSEFTTE